MIREGRVAVNGEVATSDAEKIDPKKDKVSLDGKKLNLASLVRSEAAPLVYWLYHKPVALMVPERKPTGDSARAHIFETPRLRKIKFPLRSLLPAEARSEGMIILTNDMALIDAVREREPEVPREYFVLVSGKLSDEQLASLRSGKVSRSGPGSRPVKIEHLHGTNLGVSKGNWYRLVITDIRSVYAFKLFEWIGVKAVRVVSRRVGSVGMSDSLPPGEYRPLTSSEIRFIKGLSREQNAPKRRKHAPRNN